MSTRYLRLGIVVGGAVAAIAALHFLVFAGLREEWNSVKEDLEQNSAEWKRITQVDNVRPSDKPRIIKDKRQDNAECYALLTQVYEAYELENPDPITDHDALETAFLNIIGDYKELEESDPRVSILKSMGVEASVTEDGLFGNGFYAGPELYRVYPASTDFLPQMRGTIEMWVSPRWAAEGEETTGETMRQILAVTREGGALPRSQQGIPVPAMSIHIDKGNLIFEVVDQQQGVSLTKQQSIRNWESDPDAWHFITATWDAERKRIDLYVDGIEARATAPGTTASRSMPLTFGGLDAARYEMLLGNTTARTGARPRAGQTGEPAQFPSLSNLDRIYLGSGEEGINPAQMVIDDFRVSDVVREPAGAIDPQRARELAVDGDTVFLNNMENEFVNPRYLPDILRQMEGIVRYIASGASTSIVRKQRDELEDYKAIFGVDNKRLNRQASTIDRFFKEFTAYKFVVEHSDRNLPEVWKLFAVNVGALAPAWQVILGFEDIGYDLVELALSSGVEQVDSLVFLNQSSVIDQEGLAEFFEQKIKALEEKLPAGGMDPYSTNPYMIMLLQSQMARGEGGGGAAMPGMGMGAGSMDFTKMQEMQNLLKSYKEAQKTGTIPPSVRAEFEQQNKQTQGENPYIRRILSLGVTGDLDAIASLLQALEYGELPETAPGETSPWKRLTTVTSLSLSTNDGDQIRADITLAVHSIDSPDIKQEEFERMMEVLDIDLPETAVPEPAAEGEGEGEAEERTVAEAPAASPAG